nr:two-component sensor histidine kinase [Rhizobium sp. Khangiran2]
MGALNSLFERIALARERNRHFAADAAHELRTPLAAIRAHAQVANHAKDAAERNQAISDVLVGVERGTRVVEQLLALARVEHDA